MNVVLRLVIGFTFLFNTITYGQKIKIACVGNSITAGYLLTNPQQEAYPAQLQYLLGHTYEVGNFGLSGATLLRKGHRPYANTKEFIALLDYKADVAVIHLGLNDTDPRNWPNYKDDFLKDYSWLVDTLKKGNSKIKIYICKLTPIFSGHVRFTSGTRDWYWQIQEKIEEIARVNKIQLIDLNTPLHHRLELFADNLHPDATGAQIIAKTVYQQLTGNFGGFKLDPLFDDNMMLQRDQPISIYGSANAQDRIEVRFNNIVKQVITDDTGKWKVYFPEMKFGGPYEMQIACGTKKIQLKEILIGDIWLCSGQSNMAFPLKSSATGSVTLAGLNKNLPIRLLKFNTVAETDNVAWDKPVLDSLNRLAYFSGTWTTLNANAVANFSAVAYYFGEKLVTQENVPIGLIQLAVGGSTLESWIDRKTLEHDHLLVNVLTNWRKSDFIQDWARGRTDVNLKLATIPKQRHPYEPAYNYEAGISKLINFPIKGVIWYQGESNTHNVELFKYEMPLFVKSWREKWNANFPFYYVQLSAIDRPSWPSFRDEQRKLQAVIPNSAMAVSSDLGDSLNVHPIYKKEIGERLALLALKNTYYKNITASGPEAIKAIQKGNLIFVSFNYAQKLQPSNGTLVNGFQIQDDKGKQVTVKAKIVRNEVHLSIPENTKVTRVLYAWQPFTRANLVNEAMLPASTFSIALN